jgi:hypothetical protein
MCGGRTSTRAPGRALRSRSARLVCIFMLLGRNKAAGHDTTRCRAVAFR